MIEFLQDYTTEALPPESFKRGDRVERSDESEMYFVGRGLAAFLHDGKLVDADYRPVVVTETVVEIVQPGNRRLDAAVRAGEVMTGQPPRASSGPGAAFVEPATGTVGAPPVVLEAEIERLKEEIERLGGEVLNGADLFRDMNNSHVARADELLADVQRITAERDRADEKLAAANERITETEQQFENSKSDLSAANSRIAELEQQLGDATAPQAEATQPAGAKKRG
ncbi:hypothetical protein Q5H91_04125 [Sphingomonas sp. KR1UV-12]|uniref:Cyclic nucleotide-binding domain-containing protein n=1 Tax=Sphingomonas aurea TaxID=3063994 RepID=A0ABT9EHJ4_9SPHN|nr:hypothetical protein [Sphingomonas sp. KR1UV-12]MDP1026389.1 hypothetical protein [Sphingomonas sp. KR1UV-12]